MRIEQGIDDQAVQDTYAELLPVVGMFAGRLGHSLAASVAQPSECPLAVRTRVEANCSLFAFKFDLFPKRTSALGTAAGWFCGERVAKPFTQLGGRHRRQAAE